MGGLITVGVTVENEIFARGIEACLREDRSVQVADPDDRGDLDVAIVTPTTIPRVGRRCPLLVCSDRLPEDMSPQVVGVLPRRSLKPDQLISAVRAAAAGLRVGVPSYVGSRLDARSVEVLRLLAEGAGTREISHELGFSERTIKGVIAAISSDLGARSRAQAVAVALRNALI